MDTPPAIFGSPSPLLGAALQDLIAESFVDHGTVVSTANVVYLKTNDSWFKLALDAGTVHWRAMDQDPEPWAVPEMGWEYPHSAVGRNHALLGQVITDVRTTTSDMEAKVEFVFAGGVRLVLVNRDDLTTLQFV